MKKTPVNLKKILQLLNKGEFVTGTAIGEKLKITRSAVWKYIKLLEEEGIEIMSDKTRGYSLQQPILLLDAARIKKDLNDLAEQVNIEIFNAIDSTNDYLKQKKINSTNSSLNKKIHICLAEQQIKGRGRFGREWISPFGKNIYFSCLWSFSKDISELAGLSLVMGLAIVKTLAALGINEGIKIKWPNDVLHGSQKLAGVLIEINAETHGHSQVVIGIGLNVNMSDDKNEIENPWTSLQKITSNAHDRNLIVSHLIKNIVSSLQQFEQFGFSSFQTEWLTHDALLHKQINLQHGSHLIAGTVCGVNDQGNLLLRHADESVKSYSSGDASIKK